MRLEPAAPLSRVKHFTTEPFRKSIRVSNDLDADQDQCYVSPDLGSNCLKRLSVNDKSPLARKELRGLSWCSLEVPR